MATDSVLYETNAVLYNMGITYDFTIKQDKQSFPVNNLGVFERENPRRKPKSLDLLL